MAYLITFTVIPNSLFTGRDDKTSDSGISKVTFPNISNAFFMERTYSFDSLDDLIAACKCLERLGYSSGSAAYYYGERYFLTVSCPEICGEHLKTGITIGDLLCEFGVPLDSEEKALIDEHAVCFCREHAVDRLGEV